MPETRARLWVAEFTGKHIEGTAYLALPKKQDGFETPYILEALAPQWQPIETAPGGAKYIWIADAHYSMVGYFSELRKRWETLDEPRTVIRNPTHWQPCLLPSSRARAEEIDQLKHERNILQGALAKLVMCLEDGGSAGGGTRSGDGLLPAMETARTALAECENDQ